MLNIVTAGTTARASIVPDFFFRRLFTREAVEHALSSLPAVGVDARRRWNGERDASERDVDADADLEWDAYFLGIGGSGIRISVYNGSSGTTLDAMHVVGSGHDGMEPDCGTAAGRTSCGISRLIVEMTSGVGILRGRNVSSSLCSNLFSFSYPRLSPKVYFSLIIVKYKNSWNARAS